MDITQPDRFAVSLVAGSDPERFVIIGATSELLIATTHFLSEKELRDSLEKNGSSKVEADAIIQKARDNPR